MEEYRIKEDNQRQFHKKIKNLETFFRNIGKVAIAFSGGVDSTFLLKVAHDALGENVLALTVCSSVFPGRERKEAREFCEREGIRQIEIPFDELKVEGFQDNPPNRCYLCKKALFKNMKKTAAEEGFSMIAEGSNMDDLGDYRPGLKAIAELEILSPLREVGLYKKEIRALSKDLYLPTWGKPSFACLASRFVYGEQITKEKLHMVEQAEQLLMEMGFAQMRVRFHGNMARIEVPPEDISRFMKEKVREKIVAEFRKYGFAYVSLDLEGYRTGSMNEIL